MCGISGFVTLSVSKSKAKSLLNMNQLIRHRGPDDEGYVLFKESGSKNGIIFSGNDTDKSLLGEKYSKGSILNINEIKDDFFQIGFGHRRLSIIDISVLGHQPMSYNNELLWITYNGEIYNFNEVKNDLLNFGYKFKSNTDTEVILASYLHWGINCFEKFNGMWSMAIYDINAKKIVLSRDRFGVKPLYYFISENVFYFGSEIKQFTSLPSWNPKINPERVFDFLKWGLSDHTNETMFKHVKQLSPGSHMIIDLNENGRDINDSLKISKWYNLKSKLFNLKNLDFALYFKKLFHDSVKLRMVSDVAVGSCLSGGLDSSAIVCQMNQIKSESDKNKSLINTFSACSEFEKYDERNWIQFVTDYANVNSNYIFPELSNLYLKLDEMTWHQDEPFGSTSIFAQWCVFNEASKSNVKVILDGQGGDEVLCGYKSFFTPYLIELVKKFKLFSFIKEVYFLKVNYGHNPDFQRIIGALLPHKIQLIIRKNLRKKSSISYINTKKLGTEEGYSGYFSSGSELYSLKEASRDQITNSPVPRLLHWEDRNSMAHSVESRVPFLDYKLVEFCLALPNKYKISNGITKVILRNSLKEIMPYQISNRMSKLGFETPEEIWMKSNKDVFRNLIDEAILNSKGIINREAISMFNDIIEGRAKFSFELWRIISFGRWMKIFEVKTEELT